MSEHKSEWPEAGDLVVATVTNVTDFGAYAKLDEYTKNGLLHKSEIASSWIRNIRDFVRENQKLVLKVLRVDSEKGHIDLSLRRVTKRERIEKTKSWKKERKGEAIIKNVADRMHLPIEEVYQQAGLLLEEKYGLYEGFERLVKDGPEVLTKLGVPEPLANVFAQVAQERIHVKMVKVRAIAEVRCMNANGVSCIQNAFLTAKKSQKARDAKFDFYVLAAPKYGIEVSAENWKRAEDLLQKVGKQIITDVTMSGGHGSFRREK